MGDLAESIQLGRPYHDVEPSDEQMSKATIGDKISGGSQAFIGRMANDSAKIIEGNARFHGLTRSEQEQEARKSHKEEEKRHMHNHEAREHHQAESRPLEHAQMMPRLHLNDHEAAAEPIQGGQSDEAPPKDASGGAMHGCAGLPGANGSPFESLLVVACMFR